MFEALILMAAQPGAPPKAAAPATPPLELLEFLGGWSEDEQQLIDGEGTARGSGKPDGKPRRPPADSGAQQP